jgi:hypothetical protein
MENMDKGLTNKMGADSLAKIPQMPQNLSSQQFWISMKKGHHLASVVRGFDHQFCCLRTSKNLSV